jgi:hypothetical protein
MKYNFHYFSTVYFKINLLTGGELWVVQGLT